MDKATITLGSVIGSLGVLSAILGFSAEGTKLTPYTILVYGDECIYPPNPALGLGVCAAIFLLVAQVTFSAAGGCCGCCKSRPVPSETKRNAGIVCAVFSWIAAVVAWALLIEGASWNASVVRETAPFCPYLKDGIFAGGGVLALAATALGLTSFIMMRRPAEPSKPGEQSSPAAGVVTGHPLVPQPQPSKPQQPQVPPTAAHPQGYGEAPQSPPLAAAQDNGQELPAQEGRPTDAADAPPPIVVSTDQPVVPSTAPEPKKKRFWKVIGPDIARAGVRVIARVVGNVLF